MVQTALDVCNRAIDRMGGERIDEIGEDTPFGVFCQQNYADKVEVLLSKHRWVFAKKIVQLARLETAPTAAPRTYAFARPASLVGHIAAARETAADDGQPIPLEQLADYIYADEATVWVEYTYRVPEAAWPACFVELVKTAFAADLARHVQNRSLAAELETLAFGEPQLRNVGADGGLLLAAKVEDGRNAKQRRLSYDLDDNPLTSVRSLGVTPGWGGEVMDG